MSDKLAKRLIGLALIALLSSCRAAFFASDLDPSAVHVPYMKNSSNECYFLDDFMPTPDSMTTGRNGNLSLRYYSYKMANYKDWKLSLIHI